MPVEGQPWLSIVGMGEDGMSGVGAGARAALECAEVIVGSARTLALLSPHLAARALAWPSPMMGFVTDMLARERGRAVAIVASGDPMFFGIGGAVSRRIDAGEFTVYPQPSSYALACGRLGWPEEDVLAISVVGRAMECVRAAFHHGRRIIVLCEDGTTPASLARALADAGFGATAMTVFEALGGPHERRIDGVATTWPHARVGDLNVAAFLVARAIADVRETDAAARARSALAGQIGCVPGLPDEAFAHDGALTKRDARAISLARLAPRPGELLWDVGAGAGSIGIEWMRAHPACRALAFEREALRAARISVNARALGVPDLRVIAGVAPASFAGCERPQAIFIGGGLTSAGVLDAALAALDAAGRLVANAVTLEAERALLEAQARHGGELTRIALERAEPIGTMLGWRPAMPLVQWTYRR
ncbi:MAG: bifunctional cobalt-precorrin-7 (C(5))-methyltransferase/cobalt-precorrin-6B (C(15))-methyltransferase [Vulcanimicrobiaceae bacterium]